MILYLKKVRELLKKFVRIQVKHVLRTENSRADALAKLEIASQEDLERRVTVKHLMEPSVNVNSDEVLHSNDRVELDGPHLGLSVERYTTEQSE